MAVDLGNVNLIWASVLVESLKRLGLTKAIICPGSRSTPLAFAFARDETIEAIPVLDERSAAFFALGLARQVGLPVALVCTSGTAGANFYPALIEAKEARVPLLVLTADRPQELRDCNAGQAIDQVKLFGSFPNWHTEVALPSSEQSLLSYLRQTALQAWQKALWPVPGPVHLNLPFREPLVPTNQQAVDDFVRQLEKEYFFAAIAKQTYTASPNDFSQLNAVQRWQQCHQGLLIAGPAQPQFPEAYCQAVARISISLGWPVLAEALSPLRNYASLNPHLVSAYDIILRNQELAQQLKPELVIRVGEMPTSKVLRLWLTETQPECWVVDPADRNLDPLHLRTNYLRLPVEKLAQEFLEPELVTRSYLHSWQSAQQRTAQAIDQLMEATNTPVESKVAWLLAKVLPKQTPIFIANSMPVRDLEFFWQPNQGAFQPFFNRGANGIDGTLSTALGIAHSNRSAVLLTGDLALLHDTNGFLLRKQFTGHLTIVLINNNGGGIFENLPIAGFNPPFEEFFGTPQDIDFAKLANTYDVEYELVSSWGQLTQRLSSLPEHGIRLLEWQTNRKQDALWRKVNLARLAEIASCN
ncbi:2-succinyl-5-enolpyruvyl-6-hydroxy-3-cyclohexene-1-carboxylic-acid synthase [Leptolyngbya sp. FACHB-261]|uniref:2-succinyl-5-enolpyruvyl-6-hydroxy-3- cyclohexene-1-carboxylic-acid synthase n=1 Tax=Leptolyngbya sp. FACHB-261 TaxID=2692806 RepID=UPI0016892661|nr:2-succinyl-5-enolpyruvyl-6-hydroxy-3-cyclohexene-1-carboxylic-acid synthase [Leptolyngbya sp. FACHB-261]MBD2099373.1 2-succinyl-5-enolpyruvyl-6-hydroxy-3-cyclohexene-1-carboxylic-acid synthase [Leptolyngbya sp. FACHB-261]